MYLRICIKVVDIYRPGCTPGSSEDLSSASYATIHN